MKPNKLLFDLTATEVHSPMAGRPFGRGRDYYGVSGASNFLGPPVANRLQSEH